MVNIVTLAVVFASAFSVAATNFVWIIRSCLRSNLTWLQHVNRGCILVDGRRICDGQSTWVPDGNGNPGSVGSTRYSKSKVRARLGENPECEKDFFWPGYYGDIYYGADNCLYDATGMFSWPTVSTHITERLLGSNLRDMSNNPQCC